jgi:hypothetical protein
MRIIILAKHKYNSYIQPIVELSTRLLQQYLSIFYYPLRWLASPLLRHLARQLQLIDSQLFLQHREYIICLFQKQ